MGTVKYSSKGRLVFQILYEMQSMAIYIKISIVLLNHRNALLVATYLAPL